MDENAQIERMQRVRRASPFLTTDQAAAYLAISARSLKRLRVSGKGPVFRRHARYIQYHIDDLESWSREQSARTIRHG